MNNYTTIEQSRKLIEAGLNPKTADMSYRWTTCKLIDGEPCEDWLLEIGTPFDECGEEQMPCWSVGALLDLIPMNIIDKKGTIQPRQIICNGVYYSNICYFNNSYGLFINVYECICWLLKNGYITSTMQEELKARQDTKMQILFEQNEKE